MTTWRERAEAFLREHGPTDAAVDRLAALLEETARAERRACVQIAEEVMSLYGSHAAEKIADRIRARESDVSG